MPGARAGASRTRAAPSVGRASTSRRNYCPKYSTTASSRRFPSPSCTRTGRTPWSWRARASKGGGGATPRAARRTTLPTSRGSASTRATGGGTRGRRASRVLRVNFFFIIPVGAHVASMAFRTQNPFSSKIIIDAAAVLKIQPTEAYRGTPPGLERIYFQGWAQQQANSAGG